MLLNRHLIHHHCDSDGEHIQSTGPMFKNKTEIANIFFFLPYISQYDKNRTFLPETCSVLLLPQSARLSAAKLSDCPYVTHVVCSTWWKINRIVSYRLLMENINLKFSFRMRQQQSCHKTCMSQFALRPEEEADLSFLGYYRNIMALHDSLCVRAHTPSAHITRFLTPGH